MNLFSRIRSECPSQISSHRTFTDTSLAGQNQNLNLGNKKVIPFFISKVYLMFEVSESILNLRDIHIGRGFFARSTGFLKSSNFSDEKEALFRNSNEESKGW